MTIFVARLLTFVGISVLISNVFIENYYRASIWNVICSLHDFDLAVGQIIFFFILLQNQFIFT